MPPTIPNINWSAVYGQTSSGDSPVKTYYANKKQRMATQKANNDSSIANMQMQLNIMKTQLDMQKFAFDQGKEFDKNNPEIRLLEHPESDDVYLLEKDEHGNWKQGETALTDEQVDGYRKYNEDRESKRALIFGGYATASNVNNPDIYNSAQTKQSQDISNNNPPPSGLIKETGKGWISSIGKTLLATGKALQDKYVDFKTRMDSKKQAKLDAKEEARLTEQDDLNKSLNRVTGKYEYPVRVEKDDLMSIEKIKNEGNVPTFTEKDGDLFIQNKLDKDPKYVRQVKKKLERQYGGKIDKDTKIEVAPKEITKEQANPDIRKERKTKLPSIPQYEIKGVVPQTKKTAQEELYDKYKDQKSIKPIMGW